MESKPRTLAFLAITIILMAAWASMFTSPVYRLLIITWRWFAMTSVIAMILMVVTLLLALYSWFNLDVGLAEYRECSVSPFVRQALNTFIVKDEEPPHPADAVRWSLAITSDPEKLSPLTSGDGMSPPQVTWVRLPSPIAKPSTMMQKMARSHLTASAPTNGSKGSHWRTNGTAASKLIKKPHLVSLKPDSYPSPPPQGSTPPPYGLTVTSVSTPPNQASVSVPPLSRTTEFEQIALPPQAVARGLPTLLEAAATDSIRHKITDNIVIPKHPRLHPPRAGERLPPAIGFPTSVKASQRNRL